MSMSKSGLAILSVSVFLAGNSHGQLIISEYLANPSGSPDSPFEFVELIATEAINFSTTPYSVVFANNGTATAQGWTAGGALTYGFNINSGSVNPGDVVYVGGSSMTPTGTKLRVLDPVTTPGDAFGAAADNILGNGGANADGLAVFRQAASALTPETVPVDAIFFGTSVGASAVSATEGYQLPVNDLYAGGKLQSTSFVGPDPGGGQYTTAAGTFDVTTGTWIVPRTFAQGTVLTDGTSSIVLVPEPGSVALFGIGGLLLGALVTRRRRS